MTTAAGIVAATLASLGLVVAITGAEVGRSIALGMLAPLLAVAVSWVAVERTHRRDPAGVMTVLLIAFAGKALFFGAYVAAMVTLVRVDVVPFVVSFTGYFVTLYLLQAVLLQRLVARGAPKAPPQ